MRRSAPKSALVSSEMDSVRLLRDRKCLSTSFPHLQITSISDHRYKLFLWRINSRRKLQLSRARRPALAVVVLRKYFASSMRSCDGRRGSSARLLEGNSQSSAHDFRNSCARPELREEHRNPPAARTGGRESSSCAAVTVGTDWLLEDQRIICLY
jgi:hypothetical protein